MIQDNQDMRQLLDTIAQDNALQNRYLRKQLFFTRILAVASSVLTVALLVVLLIVMPPLFNTMGKATDALDQAARTLSVMDDTMEEIQGLFAEGGMVDLSSEALRQTAEKIGRMDIDSLNAAIKNLEEVVAPFAGFFEKFK